MALTQLTYTEYLTRILHSMMMQRRTGLLSIEHVAEEGREHGEVYFEAGEVTIARTGRQVGVAALAAIQQWEQVYYTFYEDATIPLPRITEDRTLNPHPPAGNAGPVTGTGKHRRLSGTLPAPSHATSATPSAQNVENHGLPRNTRPLPMIPATPRPQAIPVISHAMPSVPPIPTMPSAATQPVISPTTAPTISHTPSYPGVNAIFRSLPTSATTATMYRLERRERIIFALLDGRRTLKDIARLTHQTDVAVARVLAKLLAHGYIEHLQG